MSAATDALPDWQPGGPPALSDTNLELINAAILDVETQAQDAAVTADAALSNPVAYSRLPVGQAANTVAAGDDTRFNPPIFAAVQTVSQALAANAFVAVTLTTEEVDTHNGHSTSSNMSRYVAPIAGWYRVSGGLCIADMSGSKVGGHIAKNGNEVPGTSIYVATNGAGAIGNRLALTSRLVFLNGTGDYVEIKAVSSSAASTVVSAPDVGSCMTVEFVRGA